MVIDSIRERDDAMQSPEQSNFKAKRISVSSKRQISIPKEYYDLLNIGNEVIIELRNDELVIKPIQQEPSGEFSQYILRDLIKEGYEGEELYQEFINRQRQVRPALLKMIEEERQDAKQYTLDSLDELFEDDYDNE